MSGVAFALANLLLARTLSKEEYGRFALLLAIAMIGSMTGTAGANVIVNRYRIDAGPRLLGRVLATSGTVALVLAIAAGRLYPLDAPLLAVMIAIIVGAASKQVAAAHYQSRQRYGFSLFLSESTNLSLLITGGVAAFVHPATALAPAAVFAACLAMFSAFGWWSVARDRPALGYPDPPFPWREALSVVGTISAGIVLVGLERLVIPRALGLPTLATFSVLSTLAGSPFQMLNLGVGFALLPNLRAAPGAAGRWRVLRHEAAVVLGACAVSAVAVWWLAPLVVRWFLAGRYELPAELILAAIIAGTLRPLGSLAVGTVNALGSSSALATLSGIAWAAVVVGFAGAWLGIPWGLAGLIYGAGLGWLLRAVAAGWLAVRCLRLSPTGVYADAPIPAGLAEE